MAQSRVRWWWGRSAPCSHLDLSFFAVVAWLLAGALESPKDQWETLPTGTIGRETLPLARIQLLAPANCRGCCFGKCSLAVWPESTGCW